MLFYTISKVLERQRKLMSLPRTTTANKKRTECWQLSRRCTMLSNGLDERPNTPRLKGSDQACHQVHHAPIFDFQVWCVVLCSLFLVVHPKAIHAVLSSHSIFFFLLSAHPSFLLFHCLSFVLHSSLPKGHTHTFTTHYTRPTADKRTHSTSVLKTQITTTGVTLLPPRLAPTTHIHHPTVSQRCRPSSA